MTVAVVGIVGVVGVALLAGGPIADRLPTGSSVADDEITAPSERTLDRVARRYTPPRRTPAEVVCLLDAQGGCLRWEITDDRLGESHLLAAGDRLLAVDASQATVTAIGLDDGHTRWHMRYDDATSVQRMVVVDDLVVGYADGALVARGVDDGQVRWTTAAPDDRIDYLETARRIGDVLVLLAVQEWPYDTGDVGSELPLTATLVGLDVDDGTERWRLIARTGSLAPDGTAVVVDEAGDLVALEPDGEERWRRPHADIDAEGGAWVDHGFVSTWSTDGSSVHRLTDGEEVDVGGFVTWSDAEGALFEVWPEQDRSDDGSDQGPDHVPALVMVDPEGEERWRITGDEDHCLVHVQREEAVLRIAMCDSSILTVGVDDGEVVARTPPAGSASDHPAPLLVGRYELLVDEPQRSYSTMTLVDGRVGVDLARFPAGSVPVGTGDGGWSLDLGGMLVMQHPGGLVAVDLPTPNGPGGFDGRPLTSSGASTGR